jgi:uroporphyrinogen-III decarboxylase
MNHRERMLAAMRGEPADRIPWAPRMDLWCIALRARNALPPRFAGMNTADIADELDVACHAVRADVTLPRDPEDRALRGLGFENHPDHPCRIELRGLPMKFHHEDGHSYTSIQTPAGDVTTHLRMTREMAAEGISMPYVEKYPVCSVEDLEPVAQVFEHLEVIATPGNYASFHQRVGDRGLAVAAGPVSATPVHLLLHDLMHMAEFFVLYHDERDAVEAFAARLEPFFDALLEAVLACSAEVFMWGANYDQDTTWPPFFEEQIMPRLQEIRDRAHAAGKLLLTHTDGESRRLFPYFQSCGFDAGESVCPAPMTSCTLREFREGFGPDITVFGGIPCVVLLDRQTDTSGFEAHMDQLFEELGDGRRLILGVSDNVPPDVNLDRLDRIKEWIEAFGPVGV